MRKNYSNYLNYETTNIGALGVLGIILLIIISIFIVPWIYFWLSYFGGWVAKIVIGEYLVKGFALLGITIPLNKIPLLSGVLGWIGSYFKSFTSFKSNN